ncbi:MAG: EAL domain-containing protein, partial [Bulleidia sp.]
MENDHEEENLKWKEAGIEDKERDETTGLFLLRPFLTRAEEKKNSGRWVMLFYNILNFSSYNFRFGLDEGDVLLRKIAEILEETFPDCLISHTDADHFIVLAENSDDLDMLVRESYEKICKILKLKNTMDCRIGAYVWKDPEVSSEIACSYARNACDSIRDPGSGFFVYYSDQLKLMQEMGEYIRSHIDEAVQKGWIRVYYQPIIRTLTGNLCAYEALSRWDDPVYGMLRPVQYISELE